MNSCCFFKYLYIHCLDLFKVIFYLVLWVNHYQTTILGVHDFWVTFSKQLAEWNKSKTDTSDLDFQMFLDFSLHFSFESFWLTLVNSVYLAVNSTRLSLGNWEKKSCFFKGLLWWLQMNMQIYHPFIQHVLVYMYHWTEASRVYKLGADFKRKFNFWQNYLVIWSNLND